MKKAQGVTNQTVEAVLARHFGKNPKTIKRLHGGLANHVFETEIGREHLIVRISDDCTKLPVFMKEQWAITEARKYKVPTPEVLEVASLENGLPYMISRKVPGRVGTGSRDKAPLLNALGKYAAIINSIPTKDFGHNFDWSSNKLSRNKTWEDYLNKELNVEERCEIFARGEIFNKTSLKKLREQVKLMRQWSAKPSLTHGDIRLKNVILDENRKIVAMLDWEDCTSNIAPFWELSIALHDLTMDEKEMFLGGYGLEIRDYMKMAPAIKTLNILNYAGVVDFAMKEKNKDQLLSLSARLSGTFDLYSL